MAERQLAGSGSQAHSHQECSHPVLQKRSRCLPGKQCLYLEKEWDHCPGSEDRNHPRWCA